jgi:hypothetical protein
MLRAAMKRYDDRDGALPAWPSGAREGIASFPFTVTDVGLERGGFRVRVVALVGGERAGFSVVLAPKGAKAASPNPLGLSLQPATAQLVAEGAETDVFLRALAAALDVELMPGASSRPRVDFNAVTLTGDIRRLASTAARVKLFYERPVEGESFELLTNINLPERSFTLMEKWTGYRAPLVRGLTFVPSRDGN